MECYLKDIPLCHNTLNTHQSQYRNINSLIELWTIRVIPGLLAGRPVFNPVNEESVKHRLRN
ncbi:hypothetical protein Pyrfu_0242 [Pyrolobus fumarii 1A]|uniref:Uncharacterized protein n=1 Tax=Pyrolobus fumarii (strain DSM 11204 / 1A) TaxID=694429 RepID=G0EF00_PYRF1|nr:hypothetical protein Pyrfu_0242 [Pyrolobus fumarii 1A]